MKTLSTLLFFIFSFVFLSCQNDQSNSTNGSQEQRNLLGSDSLKNEDTLVETLEINPYLDSFYLETEYRDDQIFYGYKNRFGETVMKSQFDLAGPFYQGLAPVIKKGKSGLIDSTGKMVQFFEDYDLAFWNNELSGMDEFYRMNEGMYLVTDHSEKFGYVNQNNELIIPIEYDWGSEFSEGKAVVEKNEKFGFIDSMGQLHGNIEYKLARPYSEGLAAVMLKDKIGFIDHSGKYVIEPTYKTTYSFSEGLCAVSYSNEYTNFFFIDKTGKVVIDGPYDDVESFSNGEAIVEKRGKCRVIDKTGKELRKLDYDYFAGC